MHSMYCAVEDNTMLRGLTTTSEFPVRESFSFRMRELFHRQLQNVENHFSAKLTNLSPMTFIFRVAYVWFLLT